jgi:hypothetical protein
MPLGAGSAFEAAYVYGYNNPAVNVDPSGLRGGLVGEDGVVLGENPVADGSPEELALVLTQAGVKLPPRGCLPGDGVGTFLDVKKTAGHSVLARRVHLCGGVQTKSGKGSYGLAHINHGNHFGGKLESSEYAQELVAVTIDEGAHGDYRGGGRVVNYNNPFACSVPKLTRIVFIFDVTVAVDPGDRIITAFIAKDAHLDHMDPERIKSSCRAGQYPA